MSDDFSDSDLEMGGADEALDESFTHAAEHVQRIHSSLTPNDLLELYGLYKQATIGRCNTAKPSIFNMQGRAKWSAWDDLGEMPTIKAKNFYIAKVQQLDVTWAEAVQKGEKQKSLSNWVVHSVQLPPEEDAQQKAEHEKNAFDYVKECNLPRLIETLDVQELHTLDEHGMGLIHWATDRNSVEILEFLITTGVDVNLRDAEQQTALHYASSCSHLDCVRILLNFNADRHIVDADGQTCLDVAESADVRALFEL